MSSRHLRMERFACKNLKIYGIKKRLKKYIDSYFLSIKVTKALKRFCTNDIWNVSNKANMRKEPNSLYL